MPVATALTTAGAREEVERNSWPWVTLHIQVSICNIPGALIAMQHNHVKSLQYMGIRPKTHSSSG